MKTIAYQGVKGAFSYLTAVNAFGKENDFAASKTFKEVYDQILNGKADFGMIPIENSLIGSIYENYDLIHSYDMKIVGEHFTKIEHCLMSVPCGQKEESIRNIKKVLSHPKALEQCAYFFQKHPWIEAVVHIDTAAAAAEIASLNDPTYGAIASESAAEIYGLEIIQKGIEDDPNNYTRFVTVAKEQSLDEHANKCSLVMQLKHLPGSLAKALVQFADEGLNLTKIESRPQRGSLFKYHFYVDFEFIGRTQQEIQSLLDGLTQVQKLTVLGFYKKGTPWMT